MTPGPGVHRTPLPKGFLASGVNCGVRRYRPDLGLLISEVPAVVAGVFTLNECQAAPVRYSKSLLPADNIRGIFTNSGQANAATGSEGWERNLMMVAGVAKAMNCEAKQILIASTGVIGHQVDTEKILPTLPELVMRANDSAESFATAILTTDLVPKTVTTTVMLSQGSVRITGISKGSGMIHPNMATMLGYMLSDVILTKEQANRMIRSVTDLSFNMISVDGDSSTNDCCFLMANGARQIALTTQADEDSFESALKDIAVFLAKSIAADGEGATKLIEVNLKGSDNLAQVRRAARGITLSPLIKTAVHGEDPNWGRILARLGAEGVPAKQLEKMDLRLQGVLLFENGQPVAFQRDEVRQLLKQTQVRIEVNFKSGTHEATAWGCDLSRKYVDINTEYS